MLAATEQQFQGLLEPPNLALPAAVLKAGMNRFSRNPRVAKSCPLFR
jgi:hypothetical protein